MDDISLVAQAKSFSELEDILNVDLETLKNDFKKWHLTLNPEKSVVNVYHLNNREANRELNINIEGEHVRNNNASKYLGERLDRSLIYKQHIEDDKNKLKSRNNIISKLAGTTWRCHASVLKISALALVYYVDECRAPVWAQILTPKI